MPNLNQIQAVASAVEVQIGHIQKKYSAMPKISCKIGHGGIFFLYMPISPLYRPFFSSFEACKDLIVGIFRCFFLYAQNWHMAIVKAHSFPLHML